MKDPRDEQNQRLLAKIKDALPALEKLLVRVNDDWVGEDLIYRFFHGS